MCSAGAGRPGRPQGLNRHGEQPRPRGWRPALGSSPGGLEESRRDGGSGFGACPSALDAHGERQVERQVGAVVDESCAGGRVATFPNSAVPVLPAVPDGKATSSAIPRPPTGVSPTRRTYVITALAHSSRSFARASVAPPAFTWRYTYMPIGKRPPCTGQTGGRPTEACEAPGRRGAWRRDVKRHQDRWRRAHAMDSTVPGLTSRNRF